LKSATYCLLTLLAFCLPFTVHAQFEKFQGTWISQPGAEFARAVIHGNSVQLFSPCSPDPCDWGKDTAQGYWASSKSAGTSGALAMLVTRDTVTDHVIVVITPTGQDLRFDVYTRFADNDKRRPYVRSAVFHRTAGKAPAVKAGGGE
jgi:hypothetical protein